VKSLANRERMEGDGGGVDRRRFRRQVVSYGLLRRGTADPGTASSAAREAELSARAAREARRRERLRSVPQIVRRRVIPGCEPVFCWGVHAGREWLVVGSGPGRVSVLCNGAAGASSQSKAFSLWQTLSLRSGVPEGSQTGSSESSQAPSFVRDTMRDAMSELSTNDDLEGLESVLQDENNEDPVGIDGDEEWRITALAWCKFPSVKLGAHPLDPDAKYCASFAVGTRGRISVFYPSDHDAYEWRLVSVLHPSGEVCSLSWAPEGRHLVSGGSRLILWSPEAPMYNNPSGANSIGGSEASSPGDSHANLLNARSPIMAAAMEGINGGALSGEELDFDNEEEGHNVTEFDASWELECAEGKILHTDFSADGRIFASVSEDSMEVRVWFEGDSLFGNVDYLSLFHPRAVTTFHWRLRADNSSYHVKADHSHAPQTLVTLCKDQVIRVWQESDPQTEELSMFLVIDIDTHDRPVRSVSWLTFVNYFEGLRSPFPEHSLYVQEREDFMLGFNSSSPFFHSQAHSSAVWGDHQRDTGELRTGPIAQEMQSSLDWLVAIDRAGQICAWSLEGLSDSPRRDISILPWNKACNFMFQPIDHMSTSTLEGQSFVLKRPDDIYLTRRISGLSDEELLQHESKQIDITFVDDLPVEGLVQSDGDGVGSWSMMTLPSFVATCRVTQEFDPHSEKDAWPSTCVFDVNPRNIETLSFGDTGLVYSFVESDNSKMNSPYGTVTHMTLCLSRGHTSEIKHIGTEYSIDYTRNYSAKEESFWITTVDVSGFGMTWPARSGDREEEVDADAIVRTGAIPLPLIGQVSLASVSEVAQGHIVSAVIDQNGRLSFWELDVDEMVPWKSCKGQLEDRDFSNCLSLWAIRDASHRVTIGILTSNSFSSVRIEESGDSVHIETLCEAKDTFGVICVTAVHDKQLLKHGAHFIALIRGPDDNGAVCTLWGEDAAEISKFPLVLENDEKVIDDKILSVSNSSSGKIIVTYESTSIRTWAPGLCHLDFFFEGSLKIDYELIGPCEIVCVHGLYLGAGLEVLGVGVTDRNNGRDEPKLLIYSKAQKHFGLGVRQNTRYDLIASTREALSGGTLRGFAWSGRDFGLAVACGTELHLFQGWTRFAPSQHIVQDMEKQRIRSQLDGKPVAYTCTGQLEASKSVGDIALGIQLPLDYHRPHTILELLRAGCIKPVRVILKELLKVLQEKKQVNNDTYGAEESIPQKDLMVASPEIPLERIVADISSESAHKDRKEEVLYAKNDSDFPEGVEEAIKEVEDALPTVTGGGAFTGRSTGGAASALFDEDPWDSVLSAPKMSRIAYAEEEDNDAEASPLSELLMEFRVDGIPSTEQIRLTALAGVFDEIYGLDTEKGGFGDGIDEKGARFMLAFKLYKISLKVLPPGERPHAMQTADLVWALDSDSQDVLVSKCLPAGESTWDDAKRIGAGIWIRSADAARKLAEELAKTQFARSNQDPFSCSLFYFALQKISVVGGLFRLIKNIRASELLANDFSDEKWQQIAVRNAYSLLKKQRHHDAASFFLLGRRLWEAANICIKNLKDFQLASFLCLLVEGEDSPTRDKLWRNTILPLALHTGDVWLESIHSTLMGNHEKALLSFVYDREEFTKAYRSAEARQSEGGVSKIFQGYDDQLRSGHVNKELLRLLAKQPFPDLTTSFNSLEPFYVRSLLEDAKRQLGLARIRSFGLADRVLNGSMQRAASDHASTGLPLLALFELSSIASSLCESCVSQWRVRLAAQTFHPRLLRIHAKSIVPEQIDLDALDVDLKAMLQRLGKCSKIDVLESLWKVSRSSNHVCVEFSIIRMLKLRDGTFLLRLQQLMQSILGSLAALGQSRTGIKVMHERRLLPARRLAAYSAILIELSSSLDMIVQEFGATELFLPNHPRIDSREESDDDDDASSKRSVVKTQLLVMLQMYARAALFGASFITNKFKHIQELLDQTFNVEKFQKLAIDYSWNLFDYEELLEFSQTQPMPHPDTNGDDPELERWGIAFAEKIIIVALIRNLLNIMTRERDSIFHMEGQSPRSGRSSPMNLSSFHDKVQRPNEFCLDLAEELVQVCWPVNWAMLSNLYMARIPPGMSDKAQTRLEKMKEIVFSPEENEKTDLWAFIKGREQLRIIEATSRWTSRAVDQEHAREGNLPDANVFCTANSKVVYSQHGSLLLSVDRIHAMEGTLVVSSIKGCEIVKYAFRDGGYESENAFDEFVNQQGMRDSNNGRSGVDSDEESSSADFMKVAHGMGRQSMPPRVRGRSLSEEEVPFYLPRMQTAASSSSLHGPSERPVSPDGSSARKAKHQHSYLLRFRRPHFKLRRSNRKRLEMHGKRNNHLMRHSWSSENKHLLMVSPESDDLWFHNTLRMPLNYNLYCDSFSHKVTAHNRVSLLLARNRSAALARAEEERRGNGNGSASAFASSTPPPNSGTRSRLRTRMSSHGFKKEEDVTKKPVMHVTSHPFLPFYATGQYDGNALLWDATNPSESPVLYFDRPGDEATASGGSPTATYKNGYVTRVRFSEDGIRLAACNSTGYVLMWDLSSANDGESGAFETFVCDTRRTLDVAMLNYTGSIFATVGQSHHSGNLSLWDLSMPQRSCKITSVQCCQHTAAYSLGYLQDQKLLIIGGGNGQLGVFDLRQQRMLLEEDHVHHKAIRSLAVHPSGGSYFASGSTDGSVKLWTYRSGKLRSHAHLKSLHPTSMYVNELTSDSMISQRGTTDLAFSEDFLYSCGADGKVKMTPLSTLMM